MIARISLALACIILISTPTMAAQYGAWETFYMISTNGKPMCGAQLKGSDRSFLLKYEYGTQVLLIHLIKSGWRIPENQRLRVVMQVDRAAPMILHGYGRMLEGTGTSSVEILVGTG